MAIRIIMDGQFGSCGKGAVISTLARQEQPAYVVRVGGPQAGHSMLYLCPPDCVDENHDSTRHVWKMRQVPAAWHVPGVMCVIGRGAYIDLGVLKWEIEHIEGTLGEPPLLRVDSRAIVVEDRFKEQEHATSFGVNGSTREGVGAARAAHLLRQARELGSYDLPWLNPYLTTHTDALLRHDARAGHNIWIESAQGFGLSLRASGFYPFTTSQDITPQQLLSDVGLHWKDAPVRTTMLLRTFPIRIAGNSGPLDEIEWDALPVPPDAPERTTVTNLQRRIGRWDWSQVGHAVEECRPDELVLTFMDYLKPEDRDVWAQLVASELHTPVAWLSEGFEVLRRVRT